MNGWRSQRGEISVGCIIGAILLLIAAVIAIKTAPIAMRVFEFTDEVIEIADKANTDRWSEPKKMAAHLEYKAQELRLPVTADMIKINRTQKFIDIKVEFDVEIDYGFYTYVWHRKIEESRPLF